MTHSVDHIPPFRKSHPSSSRIAAADVTSSGRCTNQKHQILGWLHAQSRPFTSAEIAEAAGIDRHVVARRLPDLQHNGLVTRCSMRTCQVTGRPALTWSERRSMEVPQEQRPVILSCRCGEDFEVPADSARQRGGAHCPTCRRFVEVAK